MASRFWLVFLISSKNGISLQEGGAEQVKKQNKTQPMSEIVISSPKNSSMKQWSWLLNSVKKCSSDSAEGFHTTRSWQFTNKPFKTEGVRSTKFVCPSLLEGRCCFHLLPFCVLLEAGDWLKDQQDCCKMVPAWATSPDWRSGCAVVLPANATLCVCGAACASHTTFEFFCSFIFVIQFC